MNNSSYLKYCTSITLSKQKIEKKLKQLRWKLCLKTYDGTRWYHPQYPSIKLTVTLNGYIIIAIINSEDTYTWEDPISSGFLTASNKEIISAISQAIFECKL